MFEDDLLLIGLSAPPGPLWCLPSRQTTNGLNAEFLNRQMKKYCEENLSEESQIDCRAQRTLCRTYGTLAWPLTKRQVAGH